MPGSLAGGDSVVTQGKARQDKAGQSRAEQGRAKQSRDSGNDRGRPSNEQSSRFSVWVDCGRGYSNRVESSKSQLIFRQWPLLYSVERVEKVRKGCTETDIEGSSTTARFVIPFCFIVFSKISHSRIQP